MTDTNQTNQQLQLSQIQSSPDELIKDPPKPLKHVNKAWKCNIKRCMVLIFMVFSSYIILFQINAQIIPPVLKGTDPSFDFFVYCPYSYINKITPASKSNQGLRRLASTLSYSVRLTNQQTQSYNWNNTYVVEITSISSKPEIGSLVYCGLVTYFNSTCDANVFYRCSSPGPIFDLKVGQHADIVWVNRLNPNLSPQDPSNCMNSNASRCRQEAKPSQSPTVSFDDPTSMNNISTFIPLTPTNWPSSTHVHGAQIRPTFDGNPLSWIDNSGNRGLGALSLNDKCYYNSFDNTDIKGNMYLPPSILVQDLENNYTLSTIKINRYPNKQNPGNLWYHDHAMRLTTYNVRYGLFGHYILRDDVVEKEIGVDRTNERIVMLTTNGWQTQDLNLKAQTVYRFKFLNNNFDDFPVMEISFVYGSDCSSTRIPFTIIGADSSLFHQGMPNMTSFIIAQAERMEILILFKAGSKSYTICTTDIASLTKKSIRTSNILNTIIPNLVVIGGNTRTQINNVTLSVPFVNFTSKGSLVAVKRMRPLILVGSTLTINGRTSFHIGKSQNPTIGTYQDWYIINAMSFSHPIHVHLINFQVIKVLSLRNLGGMCTLYELDFVRQAILYGSPYRFNRQIFPNPKDTRNTDYNALCRLKRQIYASEGFTELLAMVNQEDSKDSNNVSGIDVQKLLDQYDRNLFKRLNISIAAGENYKYITNEVNEVKPYYRRWKDTAYVQATKVFVYRIRWAKSAYKDGSNDAFFNVPVDQLREYPGFVYHCHILDHQDNEMMRPIMLQLPKNTKLNSSTPCNLGPDYSWSKKVKCINNHQCK